jgi:secondary thiamine-phosphate synthase enzyme
MPSHAATFSLRTSGKGTYEITGEVEKILSQSGVTTGLVTVFVRHTSASLVIMENADPSARTDLHAYFDHLVPEDTPYFIHTYEGPDDMPSHIRTILTGPSEQVPVMDGRMTLGTWQGLFLFEHRDQPHTRNLVVMVQGDLP